MVNWPNAKAFQWGKDILSNECFWENWIPTYKIMKADHEGRTCGIYIYIQWNTSIKRRNSAIYDNMHEL